MRVRVTLTLTLTQQPGLEELPLEEDAVGEEAVLQRAEPRELQLLERLGRRVRGRLVQRRRARLARQVVQELLGALGRGHEHHVQRALN